MFTATSTRSNSYRNIHLRVDHTVLLCQKNYNTEGFSFSFCMYANKNWFMSAPFPSICPHVHSLQPSIRFDQIRKTFDLIPKHSLPAGLQVQLFLSTPVLSDPCLGILFFVFLPPGPRLQKRQMHSCYLVCIAIYSLQSLKLQHRDLANGKLFFSSICPAVPQCPFVSTSFPCNFPFFL